MPKDRDKVEVIICYSKCWACMFDSHFDPPEWHSWASSEDIEGRDEEYVKTVSKQKCACDCAGSNA